MSTANVTDISDKSWDDLKDADRDVLQELAKERDGIDGRAASEALAAALLAWDGRYEEVPSDVADEYAEEIQQAVEIGLQTDDADDEPEEDEDDTQTQVAEEVEPPEVEEDDDDEEEPAEPPEQDEREPEGDGEAEDTGRDKQLDAVGDPTKPPTERSSFIIDAGVLQTWLGYPETLVDESRIHLSEDGLRITAVDAANVAMVDTDLRAAGFESFNVGDNGPIGVNLDRLIDVVKGANAGDLIQLEHDPARGNLVVDYEGHEFTLSLIKPETIRTEPDIPDLNLDAEATFHEARTLHTAIKHANSVSDHVSLAATEGDKGVRQFNVHADGDTDSYDGEFIADDDLEWGQFGEARSLFSLDYLKDIRQSWEKGDEITVTVGNEFPCVIEQTITVDDHEVGEATFLLAPRIQSD